MSQPPAQGSEVREGAQIESIAPERTLEEKIKELENTTTKISEKITSLKSQIDEVTKHISLKDLEKIKKELEELVESWDDIRRCFENYCSYTIKEYKDAYEMIMYLPVSVRVVVSKYKPIKDATEELRSELVKNFGNILAKTSEIIRDTLSEYLYAVKNSMWKVESLHGEINAVDDKLHEIKELIFNLWDEVEKLEKKESEGEQ